MDESDVDRTRLLLELREVEAQRDELRARVDAQSREILATAARLRTLEQLFETIQAGRAYRLLRRLGRWRWVEHTLAHLPGNTEDPPPDEAPDPAVPPEIYGVAHSVPRRLPAATPYLAGFAIRNRGSKPVAVSAEHTLFWMAEAPRQHHAIEVHLDGRLVRDADVPGGWIRPGERVALFFPLETDVDGEHRLHVFIRHRAAASDEGRRTLFDIAYRVDSRATRLDRVARLRSAAFSIVHAELPIVAGRWRCRWASLRLRYARESTERIGYLRRLKHENRRLACLEKQARKEGVGSRPSYLSIDTTVACNLRCPLCFRQSPGASAALRAAGEMPVAVMDELAGALLPTAYTINMSSLGEPLLSPHLDRLLDACRRFDVVLSFTTNGTLLDRPGLLDKLIPVLHRVEISFDSGRRELFERLRGGARFEHVLANAKMVGAIRASRPDPKFGFGFSMTLYRENLEDIPDVLRIVAECGGSFLRTDIGVIFRTGDLDHSVLGCPDAYADAFAHAQRRARELGVSLVMRPPFSAADGDAAPETAPCDYLYTHACIASDGSFKPCFAGLIQRCGDLTGATLLSRWNDEQMRRLRREHHTEGAHDLCKRCYMRLRPRERPSRATELFTRGEAAR